uniref:Uncharacterized protein n=1 Tax=Anser brachyrhynchus TaxID=132585 RepID=A0A8B9CFM6_9AVES
TKRQLQEGFRRAIGERLCGNVGFFSAGGRWRKASLCPSPLQEARGPEPGTAWKELASPSSLVALIPVPTYSLSSVASILKRKMQACNQTCCHVFTLHLD